MPRNVRCALIQASNALSTERPLAQIRKAMIDKHLKLIKEQAAPARRTQILCLQELFLRPVFLCGAKCPLVRLDRACTRRANCSAHAEDRGQASNGDRGTCSVREQMPGVYFQYRRCSLMRTAAISASTGNITFRTVTQDFGRNFISRRAILVIPYSKPNMHAWAYTSATTGISPRAPVSWD